MYKAELITHKGQNRIAVYFDNKPELILRFKKLADAKWGASLKVWHLPASPVNLHKFKIKTTKSNVASLAADTRIKLAVYPLPQYKKI